MNRCKTCRFWEPLEDTPVFSNRGNCSSEKIIEDGYDEEDDVLEAGEGEILTGGNFGCIHHKPKPKNK